MLIMVLALLLGIGAASSQEIPFEQVYEFELSGAWLSGPWDVQYWIHPDSIGWADEVGPEIQYRLTTGRATQSWQVPDTLSVIDVKCARVDDEPFLLVYTRGPEYYRVDTTNYENITYSRFGRYLLWIDINTGSVVSIQGEGGENRTTYDATSWNMTDNIANDFRVYPTLPANTETVFYLRLSTSRHNTGMGTYTEW
jgi:hypothetical protein